MELHLYVGRLAKDPEQKTTNGGKSFAKFTIAVNRFYRNGSGVLEKDTTWVSCTAWGSTGETLCKHLHKGDQVLVMGRLKASAWLGEDNQPRAGLDLTVTNFSFLGNKGGAGESLSDAGLLDDSRGGALDGDLPNFPDMSDIPF